DGNDFDAFDYLGRPLNGGLANFRALTDLSEALSFWPEGFFADVTEYCRGLRLYLCSTLYCVSDSGIGAAAALTFSSNEYECVVFDASYPIVGNLPHEFMHVIDARIESMPAEDRPDWFAAWDAVMPDYIRAEYADSYTVWPDDDYTYWYASDEVWFIDTYAKTWAKEDRARTLEHLMQFYRDPASESCFEIENLALKARFLCFMLRNVLPCCADFEGELPWEAAVGVPDPAEFAEVMEQAGTVMPVG
ncbi:MAG: hypothetical protein IJL69_06510, partial [Oscillospiraceae bacterium]|nr:hypothetical protein [Oscillospiraceae bacterium]